jgi:hypothetical protein
MAARGDYLGRVMTQQSIKLYDVTSSRRLLLQIQWAQILYSSQGNFSRNEICDTEVISCALSVPCGLFSDDLSTLAYGVSFKSFYKLTEISKFKSNRSYGNI